MAKHHHFENLCLSLVIGILSFSVRCVSSGFGGSWITTISYKAFSKFCILAISPKTSSAFHFTSALGKLCGVSNELSVQISARTILPRIFCYGITNKELCQITETISLEYFPQQWQLKWIAIVNRRDYDDISMMLLFHATSIKRLGRKIQLLLSSSNGIFHDNLF